MDINIENVNLLLCFSIFMFINFVFKAQNDRAIIADYKSIIMHTLST